LLFRRNRVRLLRIFPWIMRPAAARRTSGEVVYCARRRSTCLPGSPWDIPENQPPYENQHTGTSRANNSRITWGVTVTLPKRQTWLTSINR
jgi:hypothetical protein